MKFLDAEFVKGFIRMANDGWKLSVIPVSENLQRNQQYYYFVFQNHSVQNPV